MGVMSAKRIDAIFKDCLFRSEELKNGSPDGEFVDVEGLVSRFGFHPGRLKFYRADLIEMIDGGVKSEFLQSGGGGYSCLSLCEDKDGVLWGEHRNMEQFLSLCIGLGLARYCLPREIWSAFPGGMPYVVFDSNCFQQRSEHEFSAAGGQA